MARIGVFLIAMVVAGMATAADGVWNLREYLLLSGFDVVSLVDGGITITEGDNDAQITAGSQYAADFGPEKAFDGVCTSSDASDRWLGEISTGTYLELALPKGYSCDLSSYRLWRLNTGGYPTERTATQWRMFGITENGEEVLLSECAEESSELTASNSWTVTVDPAAEPRSFVRLFQMGACDIQRARYTRLFRRSDGIGIVCEGYCRTLGRCHLQSA